MLKFPDLITKLVFNCKQTNKQTNKQKSLNTCTLVAIHIFKILGKDRDSQKRLCRSFSAVSGYINLMKGFNNCLILLSECEEDLINHDWQRLYRHKPRADSSTKNYGCVQVVSKSQLSVILPEGKRMIKRQPYSKAFTLREAASIYLSTLMSMQRLLACILHTDTLNTNPYPCPPEVKPCPMKPSICLTTSCRRS